MTIVDELHRTFDDILAKLPAEEISLRNVAAESFRKGLLLSAASLFERRMVELIAGLVRHWGDDNLALNELVRTKAIERQYHSYFDWDRTNANKFFSLFGEDFKAFMRKRLEDNANLDVAVRAFLEVGRDRNRLVHQDYGAFVLEKTADEIFDLYQKAMYFVESLPGCFDEFFRAGEGEPGVGADSR